MCVKPHSSAGLLPPFQLHHLLPPRSLRFGERGVRVTRRGVRWGIGLTLALTATTGSKIATAQYANPAGQLLPPPPPPTIEAQHTERELQISEQKDSGRGLQFFWIDPEVAFRWYDFALLSDSALLDGETFESTGFAPSVGLGAGARFLYFTGGARFRFNFAGDLPFWTAGIEAALRVPLGALEPYVLVGGGYLRTLEYKDKCGGCYKGLTVSGGYATLGGGVDYFVTPVFAVGPRLDLEIPFLSRDAVAAAPEPAYAADGSGVGLSANLGLHLSLHF